MARHSVQTTLAGHRTNITEISTRHAGHLVASFAVRVSSKHRSQITVTPANPSDSSSPVATTLDADLFAFVTPCALFCGIFITKRLSLKKAQACSMHKVTANERWPTLPMRSAVDNLRFCHVVGPIPSKAPSTGPMAILKFIVVAFMIRSMSMRWSRKCQCNTIHVKCCIHAAFLESFHEQQCIPGFSFRQMVHVYSVSISNNTEDQPVAATDLPCEKPPTATGLDLIDIAFLEFTMDQTSRPDCCGRIGLVKFKDQTGSKNPGYTQ